MTDPSAPSQRDDDLPAEPEEPPAAGELLTPMSRERREAELIELAAKLPAESHD